MREFFRGWKRKVGCVALGMACVFMACWVRSLWVCDVIDFSQDNQIYPGRVASVESYHGSLCCEFIATFDELMSKVSIPVWHQIDPRAHFRPVIFSDGVPVVWWCGLQGFGVGKSSDPLFPSRYVICMIPHWVVVFLLSLLSAGLLLSKSKQPNASTEQ